MERGLSLKIILYIEIRKTRTIIPNSYHDHYT